MTGLELIPTMLAVGAVASAGVGAMSAVQAGQTAKMAGDYNAQVDRIQAGQAAAAGSAAAARVEDQTRRQIATATNAASGSGAQISSGTPLDIMADLARQGAMDAEITRWNAGNKSAAALDQAQMDKYGGDVAVQQSYGKAATSILSAATSYGTGLYARTTLAEAMKPRTVP